MNLYLLIMKKAYCLLLKNNVYIWEKKFFNRMEISKHTLIEKIDFKSHPFLYFLLYIITFIFLYRLAFRFFFFSAFLYIVHTLLCVIFLALSLSFSKSSCYLIFSHNCKWWISIYMYIYTYWLLWYGSTHKKLENGGKILA